MSSAGGRKTRGIRLHEATIAAVEAAIAWLPEEDRVLWLRFVSGAQIKEFEGFVRWDRWDHRGALYNDDAWVDVHRPIDHLGVEWTVCFCSVHPVVATKHHLGAVVVDLLRKYWLPTLKTS